MPDPQTQAREALFDVLMSKIEEDTYPSPSMLDAVEELLTPETAGRYVEALVALIRDSQFPSMSLIKRLEAMAG
jgi:hypothetical protein